MTSHPKDATKKLIDVMASSDKIARQFHLPLQSGSTRVLGAMNRGYSAEKYLETVDYIKEKMPDAVLSTDIIVGFPGESEEDFLATLDLLRRVRYDMVFSFIYSPRKGTPAAEIEEQVPEEVKSERMNRLLELQTQIADEVNASYLGKCLRVICCGESKNAPDKLEGRTEGNKIVIFESDSIKEGDYAFVRITETHAFALYGEVVK
jgi:tRNA-2-methylthio-N6-dimethylallyladenosine synthase